MSVDRDRIEASTLSWPGCRCMITTSEASRSEGRPPSTAEKARSAPAEPTSTTTLSLVRLSSSDSISATVEEHITDRGRVLLGFGRDRVVPRSVIGEAGVSQPSADPMCELGALLERTHGCGQGAVE